MACKYYVNGKWITEVEFKAHLLGGALENAINSGVELEGYPKMETKDGVSEDYPESVLTDDEELSEEERVQKERDLFEEYINQEAPQEFTEDELDQITSSYYMDDEGIVRDYDGDETTIEDVVEKAKELKQGTIGESEDGKIRFVKEGDRIIMRDANGNEILPQTRSSEVVTIKNYDRLLKDWENSGRKKGAPEIGKKYFSKREADENVRLVDLKTYKKYEAQLQKLNAVKGEPINSQDPREIADKSNDPRQIKDAYEDEKARLREIESTTSGVGGSKKDIIYELIKGGISEGDARIIDLDNRDGSISTVGWKIYDTGKGDIDTVIDAFNDEFNADLTLKDIKDFIDEYNGGPHQYKAEREKTLKDLEKKYKELTGFNINTKEVTKVESKTKAEPKVETKVEPKAKVSVSETDIVKKPILQRINKAFLKIGTVIFDNGKQLMEKAKELVGEGKKVQFSITMPDGSKKNVVNTGVDVVNGFYSPLEKIINESKQDKMPVKQWLEKFGKGEEAKWTGLADWLSQQEASVSKADIQQYLKDNRIQVVEVVKGGEIVKKDEAKLAEIESQLNSMGFTLEADMGGEGTMLIDSEGEIADYDENQDAYRLLETYNELSDDNFNVNSRVGQPDTKFSQYQLEGEKENYKEVLVTIPQTTTKQSFELIEGRDGNWYVDNKNTGVRLTFGSEGLARSQYDKLSSEKQVDWNKTFKSSHFEEPNILVHLRMNTRTDADGNKVLFLEEVQSDWGQTGKKEGFKEPSFEWDTQLGKDAVVVLKKMNETAGFSDWKGLATAMAKSNDILNDFQVPYDSKDLMLKWHKAVNQERKVPTAPFVTDTNAWTKLGLKVALKEAVKQGATKIAWTTGEQQNDRYDLSKSVEKIRHKKNSNGFYRIEIEFINGDGQNGNVEEKDLEANVGKELAQKIIETSTDNFNTIEGNGLKVGGKGMKGFYGSPTEGSLGIVGNVAKSLFKQEPKIIQIDNSGINKSMEATGGRYAIEDNDSTWDAFKTIEEAEKELDKLKKQGETEYKIVDRGKDGKSTQHSIDITPELKATVEQGQPLFHYNDKGEILGFTHDGKIYLNGERITAKTTMEESGHIWINWAKQNRPDLHKAGTDKVKGSKYLAEVEANKNYQKEALKQGKKGSVEYNEYMLEEALSKAIADQGAKFVTESKRESFKEWVSKMWKSIAESFGIKNLSPQQISNLSIEEFAKKAAADIFSNEKNDTKVSVSKEETLAPEKVVEEKKVEKISEAFNKAADNLRKIKNKPKKLIITDENGNDIEVDITTNDFWNAMIEIAAVAIEKTGKVADGIKAAIDYLKEQDFYKNLTPPQQAQVESQIKEEIKTASGKKFKKKEPKGGVSKFKSTVSESEVIAEPLKEKAEEAGIYKYNVETVKKTAKNATDAWDQIKERTGDIDEAITEGERIVSDLNWEGTELERGALAGIIAKELNTLREQPGLSIEQINDYDNRAVELFSKVRKILTVAGQTGSVLGKFMKDYYMSYPNGIMDFVDTHIDEINTATVGKPSSEIILSVKDMLDELLKTAEGRAALDEYASKYTNNAINKKHTNRVKAATNFFDRYINDIDNLKGMTFATPIPPGIIKDALKVLKFAAIKSLDAIKAVELAVAKIKEGMGDIPFDEAKARAWAANLYEKANEQIDRDLANDSVLNPADLIRNKLNEEYQKKVNKAKEALKNLDKVKEAEENAAELKKAREEKKKAEAERDKYLEFINGLKGDKLNKFVYKIAFENLNGKNNFSEQEILRAYQQVNGGKALTVREQAIIKKNSDIIKGLWSKDNENISQKEWFENQYKIAQASTRIYEVLGGRGWYDMLSSAMAAGFLGPKTLLANVSANLLHKSYTAVWEDTILSFMDIFYSPGDTRSLQEKYKAFKNTAPTKAYVKSIKAGAKTAGKQMLEGVPQVTKIGEFDNSYQIRPLEAWRRLSDDLSRDEPFLNKMNEVAKDAWEGTAGIVHSVILRALSGGDVLFRTPEVAKFNQMIADELDVPIGEFLSDDKYAGYREVSEKLAERVTFQNKSPFSVIAGKVPPSKYSWLNNFTKWFKLGLIKPVFPYINTPINVKYEMLTTIPIFALPEFAYRQRNAKDTKLSPEDRLYNRKVAQKIMRKMIGSIPLWLSVSTLLASKFLEFVDADDEEQKDAKIRSNLMYFQGPPIKLRVNAGVFKGESFDAMKLGPLFDYMYIVDQTNKAYSKTDGNISMKITEAAQTFLRKNIKGTLEQTFFTGLNNLIKAINADNERDIRRILIDTYGQADMNLLLPATFNYLTQWQDSQNVLRVTKDESFITELYNKTIRKRLGFLGIEGVDIEELPAMYNVAGEQVKTNVEGQPDWIHYMFDFTRSEVSDPEKRPNVYIFKKYEETKNSDWLMPVAPRSFKYTSYDQNTKKKIELDVKLDPVLQNEYQGVLGKLVTKGLQDLFIKNPEPKIELVEKVYQKAQKLAKKDFYEQFKDKLQK